MTKKTVVIIGAGITGLSAGISWAKNNNCKEKPVLIIEKQPIVGGFVTSFKRDGFLFDTSQLIPDPHHLFDYLGIEIELKKFNDSFAKLFLIDNNTNQLKQIPIPSGFDAFTKMLIERYPQEKRNIIFMMDHIRKMFKEIDYLKVEMNFVDILKALVLCPRIICNANKTFDNYYKKFNIKNPEIKEILDAFADFCSMPNTRVSCLLPVAVLNTSLDGAYRTTKGFLEIPQQMKKRYLELDGEIMLKTSVQKIITERGKVKGVLLSNGKTVETDNVISTIDTKVAMLNLLDENGQHSVGKKYIQKLKKIKMSPSSMTISLGLDERFDYLKYGISEGYNFLTTGHQVFEKLYHAFEEGISGFTKSNFQFGIIAPSLSIKGKKTLIIRVSPLPVEDWIKLRETNQQEYINKKNKISEFVIQLIEKYLIPDLNQFILYKDIATPATFARYSGSPTGSNYDMAPYPSNFGANRLSMRTPIKGLYLPRFSHGIWPCLQSGIQVVDMMMKGLLLNGYSTYRKK